MGYQYQLAPTSAQFVHEIESMPPEALDAHMRKKFPQTDIVNPFLHYLFLMPHIYIGNAAPKEAFPTDIRSNCWETQRVFDHFSPYVVNRRSVEMLIEIWTGEDNSRWEQEILRRLRIPSRRCNLFILYVT